MGDKKKQGTIRGLKTTTGPEGIFLKDNLIGSVVSDIFRELQTNIFFTLYCSGKDFRLPINYRIELLNLPETNTPI